LKRKNDGEVESAQRQVDIVGWNLAGKRKKRHTEGKGADKQEKAQRGGENCLYKYPFRGIITPYREKGKNACWRKKKDSRKRKRREE